jgi:hypothetical protein
MVIEKCIRIKRYLQGNAEQDFARTGRYQEEMKKFAKNQNRRTAGRRRDYVFLHQPL